MGLLTEKSTDYELLDSGKGEKLERFGSVFLSRPDPQALWPKMLPEAEWQKADAVFARTWKIKGKIPEDWKITLEGIVFNLKLLPSKHVGVFPEQSAQWKWLKEKIQSTDRKISVLNLFANTGGATLAAAKAGAEVTHVDAAQFAVDMAFKNRDASGLSDAPIRFMVDDARKFVEREIKRGKKYDVIVLDPPVYGKGNLQGKQGEVWNLDIDLPPLLSRLKSLEPHTVVLNGYASGYSHITYIQLLSSVFPGEISSGEVAIQESSGERVLPSGIYARVS